MCCVMGPRMESCRVCGSTAVVGRWSGPIRAGSFGQQSAEPHTVLGCDECGTSFLPDSAEALVPEYSRDDYRIAVDGTADRTAFCRLHDSEQARHLAIVGTENLRGSVVADIGCGGGAFLDSIRGLAAECIGVEPSDSIRSQLAESGYATYPLASDAQSERAGSIDLAVSFAVLEHTADPVQFVRDVGQLLRPNGVLWLSTPNADDLLLELLPEDYPHFFYRAAHRFYFTPSAFARVVEVAGLEVELLLGVQRFGLGNALRWMRDRRPQGDADTAGVTPAIDAVWRAELERTLRCDYLYLKARKSE